MSALVAGTMLAKSGYGCLLPHASSSIIFSNFAFAATALLPGRRRAAA